MLLVLAAARFFHFTAISLLFGLAVFPFYAKAPMGDGPPFKRALKFAAVAALVSTWLLLAAATADIGGDLSSAWSLSILSTVVTDTEIGRVTALRVLLCLVILALRIRPKAGPDKTLAILSGVLLASVALTGHSALPGGAPGVMHMAADAAHLIAAGWWIGGLLALALLARSLGDQAVGVLERFSGLGYAAVAAIVFTGLFKSAILLSSLKAVETDWSYGWVLLAKVGLFAAMGGLALANHFWITPALRRGGDPALWLGRLQTQVTIEFVLGLTVLAAVGLLGAMAPPAAAG